MPNYSITIHSDGGLIATIEVGERNECGNRSYTESTPVGSCYSAIRDPGDSWRDITFAALDKLAYGRHETLVNQAVELRRRLSIYESGEAEKHIATLRTMVRDLWERAVNELAMQIDMGDEFGCAQFNAACDKMGKGLDWEAVGIELPEDHGVPDYTFKVAG